MTMQPRMHRREFLGLTAAFGAVSLTSPLGAAVQLQDSHLGARPAAPSTPATPGETALGLGSGRDGLLYVPRGYDPGRPTPLVVMLHGAGRDAQRMRSTFPLADDFGLVIVAPDSRGQTWDAIEGRIGPDVEFIDAALRSVFAKVRVNPTRLAMSGFSDGASYALGLGLANGDLFSHLIAFSPGFVTTPSPRRGKPSVFISHGTQDAVLPIDNTSRVIAPRLKAAGYNLMYREFEGPHQLLPGIVREAFAWLVK
jgi:phospholipase/carboxylesterase